MYIQFVNSIAEKTGKSKSDRKEGEILGEINLPVIKVKDRGTILEIGYEDLIKYHGYNMIGGVALAYKIMLWGFPKLTDEVPERGRFYFYSGIGPGGQGVIDAVEMVMRVKTLDRLNIDKSYAFDKPGAYCPGGGHYYFEIGYGEKKLCLAVKDGAIPGEFIRMSELAGDKRKKGEELSEEELRYLHELRHQLSEAVISSDPDDLFFVVYCE